MNETLAGLKRCAEESLPGGQRSLNCRVCGNTTGNRKYRIAEMMFGTGDVFEYFECNRCGCLQIAEIPSNLPEFYPQGYYSLEDDPKPHTRFRSFVLKQVCRYALCGPGPLGGWTYRLLSRRLPTLALLGLTGVRANARILDVGSGTGRFVRLLRRGGFAALGIDPYVSHDICDSFNAPLVLNRSLHEHCLSCEEKYDVIIFDHSFEHLPDPLAALSATRNLLESRSSATCIIQTPTVSSWAWEHYREHWVQLDAPRHLHLQSLGSMCLLASKAGFKVERVLFTSTEFQFWGSEQYRRGVPLMSDGSYRQGTPLFSRAEIAVFRRRAASLNAAGKGDQAAFFLKPTAV